MIAKFRDVTVFVGLMVMLSSLPAFSDRAIRRAGRRPTLKPPANRVARFTLTGGRWNPKVLDNGALARWDRSHGYSDARDRKEHA